MLYAAGSVVDLVAHESYKAALIVKPAHSVSSLNARFIPTSSAPVSPPLPPPQPSQLTLKPSGFSHGCVHIQHLQGSCAATWPHLLKCWRRVTCGRVDEHLQLNTWISGSACWLTDALTYTLCRLHALTLKKQDENVQENILPPVDHILFFWLYWFGSEPVACQFFLNVFFGSGSGWALERVLPEAECFFSHERNLNLFCWLQRHVFVICVIFFVLGWGMKWKKHPTLSGAPLSGYFSN